MVNTNRYGVSKNSRKYTGRSRKYTGAVTRPTDTPVYNGRSVKPMAGGLRLLFNVFPRWERRSGHYY
jgi:hypothetical protein